jgi:hypothetical protein
VGGRGCVGREVEVALVLFHVALIGDQSGSGDTAKGYPSAMTHIDPLWRLAQFAVVAT